LGQGRKGGDEEAADEYDPDTPQEYEAEDIAQVFQWSSILICCCHLLVIHYMLMHQNYIKDG
jgi:hypothetical protein